MRRKAVASIVATLFMLAFTLCLLLTFVFTILRLSP